MNSEGLAVKDSPSNNEPITQPIQAVIVNPDESGDEYVQRYCVVIKYIPKDAPDTRTIEYGYEKVIFKKKPGILDRCVSRIKNKGILHAIYLLDIKAKEPHPEIYYGREKEKDFDLVASSILKGQLEGKSKRQTVRKMNPTNVTQLKPRVKLATIIAPAIPWKNKWEPPYTIKSAGVDTYEPEVEVIGSE